MRLRSDVGAATTYIAANAGTTRSACRLLVRKPTPTKAAPSINHGADALSTARVVAHAPRTSSSTSNASGLLKRNIKAATGVSASTVPASSPEAGPNHRRTVANSIPTAATPSRACGARMLHALTPKTRAEISITHREAGGLSTVIRFAASDEPKNIAFQLCVPACTAAE